jgi:hypothetical protein
MIRTGGTGLFRHDTNEEQDQGTPRNDMAIDSAVACNENRSLCAACGGACCRTRPGIDSPERFLSHDDPAGHLFSLLASGNWVLDRHLGLPETPDTRLLADRMGTVTWYPRPATVQEQRQRTLTGLPQAGECVYLGSDGCALSFRDRPYICRALEPASDECHSPWSRADAALAWWPLQEMVLRAADACSRRFPGMELTQM